MGHRWKDNVREKAKIRADSNPCVTVGTKLIISNQSLDWKRVTGNEKDDFLTSFISLLASCFTFVKHGASSYLHGNTQNNRRKK